MKREMKVSVIIPVYNQKHRLKMVLKEFNNQNYNNWFEVVVVDDGSTDNVKEFIGGLEYNYNFVYKKLEKNSGRAISRNEGVSVAQGDILIFCDADRIPCRNFIGEHVKSHLANTGEIVVLGKIVELFLRDFENQYDKYISASNKDNWLNYARNFNYYDYIEEMYDSAGKTDVKIAWSTLFTSNFSITKELFMRVNGFDEDFTSWGFENFEFGYRLSMINVKYILNRRAENFHIFHGADRVGSRREDSFRLFSLKHSCPEVENVLKLLDGEISWQRLNAMVLGTEENMRKESFFNPNSLGKRYKGE